MPAECRTRKLTGAKPLFVATGDLLSFSVARTTKTAETLISDCSRGTHFVVGELRTGLSVASLSDVALRIPVDDIELSLVVKVFVSAVEVVIVSAVKPGAAVKVIVRMMRTTTVPV